MAEPLLRCNLCPSEAAFMTANDEVGAALMREHLRTEHDIHV